MAWRTSSTLASSLRARLGGFQGDVVFPVNGKDVRADLDLDVVLDPVALSRQRRELADRASGHARLRHQVAVAIDLLELEREPRHAVVVEHQMVGRVAPNHEPAITARAEFEAALLRAVAEDHVAIDDIGHGASSERKSGDHPAVPVSPPRGGRWP